LDAIEYRKSCPCQDSNTGRSASTYTDSYAS
jgi:hypothetical protein